MFKLKEIYYYEYEIIEQYLKHIEKACHKNNPIQMLRDNYSYIDESLKRTMEFKLIQEIVELKAVWMFLEQFEEGCQKT